MNNRTRLARVELLKVFALDVDRSEGYPKDRYESGPMKDANGIESGAKLELELTVDGRIVFTRVRERLGDTPLTDAKVVGVVPTSAALGWWES